MKKKTKAKRESLKLLFGVKFTMLELVTCALWHVTRFIHLRRNFREEFLQ